MTSEPVPGPGRPVGGDESAQAEAAEAIWWPPRNPALVSAAAVLLGVLGLVAAAEALLLLVVGAVMAALLQGVGVSWAFGFSPPPGYVAGWGAVALASVALPAALTYAVLPRRLRVLVAAIGGVVLWLVVTALAFVVMAVDPA